MTRRPTSAKPLCSDEGYYSTSEIIYALTKLSVADWERVLSVANFLARRSGGDDLLVEAVTRFKAGRRRIRRQYTVVEAVIGTMRSIASECENRLVSVAPLTLQALVESASASPSPAPDEIMIAQQEIKEFQALLKQRLEKSPLLWRLWETKLLGLKGSDAQLSLGLTDAEFKALDKQLRRLLGKVSEAIKESQ